MTTGEFNVCIDEDIEFVLQQLPPLKKGEFHVLRIGSIQFSSDYSVLSVLNPKNEQFTARYTEIVRPLFIEKFPDKSKANKPLSCSYVYCQKFNIEKLNKLYQKDVSNLCALKRRMKYFYSQVKSENITGNQYVIIFSDKKKFNLVNCFSSKEFKSLIIDLFSKISLPEKLQTYSLCPKEIDSVDWYLKNQETLNESGLFSIVKKIDIFK